MDQQQITLEDGHFYVVEFPFTSERGETERTVVQFEQGRFWSTNDAAVADAPSLAEDSIYTVIRKVDLWAA
jgi:hypothetical protein